MAESTYKTMTLEYLGDRATEDALRWFREACAARQAVTGEDDVAVTEWMWGDGNWGERAVLYCDPFEL